MPRRAYPKRVKEGEERIVISFSLSAETRRAFCEAYSIAECHEPSVQEVREKARDLAFQSIGAYIKEYLHYGVTDIDRGMRYV